MVMLVVFCFLSSSSLGRLRPTQNPWRDENFHLRRYQQGRIVCNKDSEESNVWLGHSELASCGRPMTQEKVVIPLNRELILPEALDADDGIRVAERQRPSPETVAAQKGKSRWGVLLKSLLTIRGGGFDMAKKAVIVVNYAGYVEDVGCSVACHQVVSES